MRRLVAKPHGIIETNHLMQIIDGDNDYLFELLREIYGYCYENVTIDERTGEIEVKEGYEAFV